jgi:hypothetical protein
MDLDDVTDAVREAVNSDPDQFRDAELVATRVTGRVGEFYLTIDTHQYLITIEPVEDHS